MTLKDTLEIASIFQSLGYAEDVDANGERRKKTEFDWTAEPWESANEVRRDVIAKLVSGMPVDPSTLSPWAQIVYPLWQEDAQKIMLMGVSPDPRYAPKSSLVGRRIRKTEDFDVLGEFISYGTIVMECGNGVVVEWDYFGAKDGYSDRYKSVILIKSHTERKEFLADDRSVSKYELESEAE